MLNVQVAHPIDRGIAERGLTLRTTTHECKYWAFKKYEFQRLFLVVLCGVLFPKNRASSAHLFSSFVIALIMQASYEAFLCSWIDVYLQSYIRRVCRLTSANDSSPFSSSSVTRLRKVTTSPLITMKGLSFAAKGKALQRINPLRAPLLPGEKFETSYEVFAWP